MNNRNRAIAKEQDKRVAKQLGLNIQRASGSVAGFKGDLYDEKYLIETKTKAKQTSSFTIKRAWIDKIEKEAFQMGKDGGLLVFSFGDNKDFCVMSLEELEGLLYTIDRLTEESNTE